jgi:hypothetical protein
MDRITGQINVVDIPTHYAFKVHFNNIPIAYERVSLASGL